MLGEAESQHGGHAEPQNLDHRLLRSSVAVKHFPVIRGCSPLGANAREGGTNTSSENVGQCVNGVYGNYAFVHYPAGRFNGVGLRSRTASSIRFSASLTSMRMDVEPECFAHTSELLSMYSVDFYSFPHQTHPLR
jgi:hypothetical protein